MEQGVTPLYVDNSGAVELSRDRKSCHRSRHVDRRYFKVRELAALNELAVQHIDTADNPADLLTKPLPFASYSKHRTTLMNLDAPKVSLLSRAVVAFERVRFALND